MLPSVIVRGSWGRASLGLAAAALVLSAWHDASAQEPLPADPSQVTFAVSVCLASSGNEGVDPECESLQAQLPVRFGTLKIQQREDVQLGFGELRDLLLPTGSQVHFRPLGILQGKLHVFIDLPGFVNTRVQLDSGRSVILAGVPYREGNLIIELRPSFVPPPPPATVVEDTGPPRRVSPEVRRVGVRRVGGGR